MANYISIPYTFSTPQHGEQTVEFFIPKSFIDSEDTLNITSDNVFGVNLKILKALIDGTFKEEEQNNG